MDYRLKWVPPDENQNYSFDFLLTKWIYPIEKPVILSEKFQIALDNPRTQEELIFFTKLFSSDDIDNTIFKSVSSHLDNIINLYKDVCEDCDHKLKINTFDLRGTPIENFSKMFVILRFNRQHKFYHLKMPPKIRDEDFTEEDELWFLNKNNAISYCSLISLIISRQNKYYDGESFILETNSFRLSNIISDATSILIIWMEFVYKIKEHLVNDKNLYTSNLIDWHFFPLYEKDLLETAKQLELTFEKANSDQLLYVGELLRQASNTEEEKLKFITLVSIIELLLTHNPDSNRYNVEDSINKQFILKTSIVVYKRDRNLKIKELGEQLKTIYTQRSNIAHGNFKEFKTFLEKLRTSNPEIFFIDYIGDCYWYIKLIIEEYVNDFEYIEFIKAK